MKKNFVKMKWLFTALLFMAALIIPSIAWADNITPTRPNGEGIKEKPYQIGTAAELYWFAGLVNEDYGVCTNGINQNRSACAELTADIIVNERVLTTEGELVSDVSGLINWNPITRYYGTFNGQGHTISGLYFVHDQASYGGLFGHLQTGALISNVGIIDSYFSANYLAGGICGYNENGTITGCYNAATIKNTPKSGGVCGKNESTITNCINYGVVSGTQYVGGVCGENVGGEYSAIITNCYNCGTICAANATNVGGVSGKSHEDEYYGATAVITNCYFLSSTATGGIDGTDEIGSAEAKTIEQFKSGEVAYLLSQGCTVEKNNADDSNIEEIRCDGSAWGQDIATEEYPVLNSPYKVLMAAQNGEDGGNYWATFSNLKKDVTLSVPSDRTLEVYNATVSGGKMTLTQRSDNQVAKEEGVLLKTDGAYVNAKANETNELAKVPSDDNHLVATPAEAKTVIADAGYKLYRLTYKNTATKEDLGFYLSVDKDNNSSNGTRLKATPGKAYLQVYEDDAKDPSSAALARSFVFGSDSETTGIEGITIIGTDLQRHNTLEGIFDLQGRKISNPTTGIYIKNNKKVIIK